MKAYKITLFIFLTIVILAIFAWVFPTEGIQLGGLKFEFPSLYEILSEDNKQIVVEESPEELVARRLADMRLNQEKQYQQFFAENPARFHFPNDSIELFDSFFAALDNAQEVPMRILHYGDSQIEEDRITNMFRENLQAKFGGYGVGYVPVIQTIPTISMGQSCDTDLPRYMVYGTADKRADHRRYGIAGQFAYLDTVVKLRFFPRNRQNTTERVKYFSKLTLLIGQVDKNLIASITDGETQTITAPSYELKLLDFQLSDSTQHLNLTLKGKAELYGILLDGTTGLQVDNMPMRGCSGTIFTSMDRRILADFYSQKNVQLIILQFGGNSMPYLKTIEQIERYKASIIKQINYLKSIAPHAQFLFIGPSDMSTRIKGIMQTYPMLQDLVEGLKQAANECNAVYWDLYSVMGGRNSMINWVNSSPPLASIDHVHLTQLGASKIGDMLYKSLMLYYDYYEFRTKEITHYLVDSDN